MEKNNGNGSISVEVQLYLENSQLANKIEKAITFFSNSNNEEFGFNGIEHKGTRDLIYYLTFHGCGDARKIADDVHRFLSAFIDEFYDEDLEDDWMNEIDSDELPIIQKYEVLPARKDF
jgi:hypothetical protein